MGTERGKQPDKSSAGMERRRMEAEALFQVFREGVIINFSAGMERSGMEARPY